MLFHFMNMSIFNLSWLVSFLGIHTQLFRQISPSSPPSFSFSLELFLYCDFRISFLGITNPPRLTLSQKILVHGFSLSSLKYALLKTTKCMSDSSQLFPLPLSLQRISSFAATYPLFLPSYRLLSVGKKSDTK